MSLLINGQATGHQSSAAPPHTEPVTQDSDGNNHDDSRVDTKATVQGTSVQITKAAFSVCRGENRHHIVIKKIVEKILHKSCHCCNVLPPKDNLNVINTGNANRNALNLKL